MSPAEVTVESGEMKLPHQHEGVIDLPVISGLRPWCNFSDKIENVGMHFTLSDRFPPKRVETKLSDAICDRLSQH